MQRRNIKEFIKRFPVVRTLAKGGYYFVRNLRSPFQSSSSYWDQRYRAGETSGSGSYGRLAEFKAKFLNEFVAAHNIAAVIEFGCGDGNQLALAHYPRYSGFDVSQEAVNRCRSVYSSDSSKEFQLLSEYAGQKADLTLSLDVIYHLVEDDVFSDHMRLLFDSSTKYVIIYSSNTEKQELFQPPHVRHRKFTAWMETNMPQWKLVQHVKNKYPFKGNDAEESSADFFVYAR